MSDGLLEYICSLFSVSPSHVISFVQRLLGSLMKATNNVNASLF